MPPRRNARGLARRSIIETRTQHNGAFLSIVPRKYKCVVCHRGHGSRTGLVKHFRIHARVVNNGDPQAPASLPVFTHPSCWPETEVLSLEQWKELTKLERDRFLNHPNSSATADAMVHYGTMNRDDLEKMKELGLLRKWWWWWNAQVDEEGNSRIRQAIANAPAGHSVHIIRPRGGIAASSPSTLPDEPSERNPDYQPDSVLEKLEEPRFMDGDNMTGGTNPNGDSFSRDGGYVADRGQVGRLTTALDLSCRKPLQPETVASFISDCNINYLAKNGETLASCQEIGRQTIAFVQRQTYNFNVHTRIHNWLNPALNDPAQDYSGLREDILKEMTETIEGAFGDRLVMPRRSLDERHIAGVMTKYAEGLGDEDAAWKIRSYRNGGDDDLDQYYDDHYRPEAERAGSAGGPSMYGPGGHFGNFR